MALKFFLVVAAFALISNVQCRDPVTLARSDLAALGFDDTRVEQQEDACANAGDLQSRFLCVIFALFNVVPDRIPQAPESAVFLYWPSLTCPPANPRCEEPRAAANFGNVLSTPNVFDRDFRLQYWPPLPLDRYYTVMLNDMFEPAQSSNDIEGGLVVYMVIGNIPGGVDISQGDVLFDYFPPVTPPGSGEEHVYTLLVYEQPDGRIEFNEPATPTCTYASRSHFEPDALRRKYGLVGPRYGNVFRVAEIEDFGPIFALFGPCNTLSLDAFNAASIPWPTPTLATAVWPGIFTAGLGTSLDNAQGMSMRPLVWIQPFDPAGTIYTIMLFEYVAGAATQTLNWLVINSPAEEPDYDAPEFDETFAYRRPEGAPDGSPRTFVFLVIRQPGPIVVDQSASGQCDVQGRQVDVDAFIAQHALELYQGAFWTVTGDRTACCDECP